MSRYPSAGKKAREIIITALRGAGQNGMLRAEIAALLKSDIPNDNSALQVVTDITSDLARRGFLSRVPDGPKMRYLLVSDPPSGFENSPAPLHAVRAKRVAPADEEPVRQMSRTEEGAEIRRLTALLEAEQQRIEGYVSLVEQLRLENTTLSDRLDRLVANPGMMRQRVLTEIDALQVRIARLVNGTLGALKNEIRQGSR